MSRPERTVIGIDIGGTKVAAAAVRGRLPGPYELDTVRVVERAAACTDVAEPRACLAGIVDCIAGLVPDAGLLDGIGIGVAATVDFRSGTLVHSVHLPLRDVPLRDELERHFGVPVAVDNDATVAAIGEHALGAGRGTSDMLMLTLGTGVGGGIIARGRPYRGFSGAAAELGHIVVDLNGPECPGACPGRGCLEAYASGTALGLAAMAEARAKPASALGQALAAGEAVDSRLLVALAERGDAAAVALLTRAGEYLGAGMVTLVNAFNPERIVVGGGGAAADELLLGPARRTLLARALPPARDEVKVVRAALGEEAGVIGAAALALTELFPDAEAQSS